MEEPRTYQVLGQYESTEGLSQLPAKALERLDLGLRFLDLKLEGSCHKKKKLVHATT